jgi:predicted GNAT family acetyltransferase
MSVHQDDDAIDEALDETFPASDPPSNTIATGARLCYAPEPVNDNRDASRFEVKQDGEVAFLAYERRPDVLVLVHTSVPRCLRHVYVGTALVKAAVATALREARRIVAVCPFVQEYLSKHPIEHAGDRIHAGSQAG